MKTRFISALVLFFALAVPFAGAADDVEVYHLVRVKNLTPSQAPALKLLGLDIVHVYPEGEVELVVRDMDLVSLERGGFDFEIKINDMAAFYEKRLMSEPTPRDFPDGSMGGNYTLSEVEAMLDGWALQYPNLITSKKSIGKSIEGRDIWAVKISDNPNIDENEPEVHFDALVHAREPQSMMTLIYYMMNLLEQYGVDPELTYLVDNREIWFVPVHNPDGYYYNERTNPNGGGMWRKNRRQNYDGSYGVDLNRNYGYEWGYDNYGSSPTPSSETYRGTAAFSEPETQAIRDHIVARPVVTSWNTHTYSNLYLCPFGYDDYYPFGSDWNTYQEYLADISAGNGYTTGTIYDVLYAANGGATDWHYGSEGVFNITPEIGGSGDGFWPTKSRILPLAQENMPAIKYFCWAAGSFVVLEDHTFADENGDGLFYPGEPIAVVLTVRNKGLAATGGDVTATLSTSSPYATIQNGTHNFGILDSQTSADNSGNILIVKLNGDTPYGESVSFDLEVTFDGYSLAVPLSVVCGVPRVLASFDMESEQGWTVGDTGDNATTGIWERDDPIGIWSGGDLIQPEDDHTPSPGVQCFVTGNNSTSAGGDDVDNGKTTLKTPLLDLSGVASPSISYWRFYCDLGGTPNNDIFQVDISGDGGVNWVNVESLAHTENYWSKVAFQVEDYITPTGSVMMRFVAKDEPNDSLCEACIDDFEVMTYAPAIGLTLSGTPSVGSSVNVVVNSPNDAGLQYRLAASTATYPALQYGGQFIPIAYDYLTRLSLNPSSPIFRNFSGYLDGAGQTSAPTINIPANPGLVGMDFYVVALTYDPPGSPSNLKNVSAPLPITVQ